MSAQHQLAEALARIEHKVDLLLADYRKKNPVLMIPPVGDFNHTCPLCNRQVKYVVDPIEQILLRKCGCRTGLQAPINLEALVPPPTGGKRNVGDQEYGSDTDEGSGGFGKRF